jgi:hypothetical protein
MSTFRPQDKDLSRFDLLAASQAISPHGNAKKLPRA